jgi:hypothetical protein
VPKEVAAFLETIREVGLCVLLHAIRVVGRDPIPALALRQTKGTRLRNTRSRHKKQRYGENACLPEMHIIDAVKVHVLDVPGEGRPPHPEI